MKNVYAKDFRWLLLAPRFIFNLATFKQSTTFIAIRKMCINYEWNIYRINSTMCIKKVTWLCTMRWENLTNHLVLKHCFGRSEIPEQSLSSKYVCITVLHDYVTKQQASSSENINCIYCVSSARSEVQIINQIWKWMYSVASPTFLIDV